MNLEYLNTTIGFSYMIMANVFNKLNEKQNLHASNILLAETLVMARLFVEMHSVII